jgi:enoyl-CoA hydratase
MTNPLRVIQEGAILVVTINRWEEARNAIDLETSLALASTFREFDRDDALSVAVVTGAGGTFCSGADLKGLGDPSRRLRLEPEGDGPLGFSRLALRKPVLAAVEGHAVAGGLELALWCDLRVAAEDAVFGVFCRRWGVPLIDGGTVRLARLIGQSRALDMILTGRAVSATEALSFGLANRVVPKGQALAEAVKLAQQIARFPQGCLRSDRRSVYDQWSLPEGEAMKNEFRHGMDVVLSGETAEGAARFADGKGRHGSFE